MRILAVRLSAMGDLVQALPAIRGLARRRPGGVAVAVQRPLVPLLAGLAELAAVVPHDRRPPLRGMFALRRRLRPMRFDVALDLQGNWKSAMAAWLSGAPERLGSARGCRREPRSAVLLTREIPAGEAPPHPARLALDVVRAVAPDVEPVRPALEATAAELDAETAALARLGIDASRPFWTAVLGPAADNRTWQPAALARELAAAPQALVVSGPAERGAAAPPGLPHLRHAGGELRRLVALGVLLRLAGGRALGPDLGATQVLAAGGAPTTVLYGPQDPHRTAPLGAEVLRRVDGPPCVPCRRRRCDHRGGPVCMDFGSHNAVSIRVPLSS